MGVFKGGVGRGKMALATDYSIVLARVMVCVPTSYCDGTIYSVKAVHQAQLLI